MSRRAYGAFLVLTAAWLTAAFWLYPVPYGWFVAGAIVWWGILVMLIATGYYMIQEAPAARVTGWIRRDLVINLLLFLALLAAALEGLGGYRRLSLPAVGWITLSAAAVHPIAVDWVHHRRLRIDPAGSPIPQYVPPVCLWIDFTVAALVIVALLLLQ